MTSNKLMNVSNSGFAHDAVMEASGRTMATVAEEPAAVAGPAATGCGAATLPTVAPVTSISTKRLLLRPYRADDEAAFIMLNVDPMVRRHLGGPLTPAAARTFFNRIYPGAGGTSSRGWAITTRGTDQFIGHAFLARVAETPIWEMGFMLRLSAWGNGYATEVARALVRHGLIEGGIQQIITSADSQNTSLIKVLEKIGMSLHSRIQDATSARFIFAIGPRTKTATVADQAGFADLTTDVRLFFEDRLNLLC